MIGAIKLKRRDIFFKRWRKKNRNKLLAAFFFALSLIFINLIVSVDKTQMTFNQIFEFNEIIIDAGHGGIDGGAVGVSRLLEKDINLDIAKKVEVLLKISGYNVTMTRSDDSSLHDKNANTIRKQKTSDLKNRLNIINKNLNSITISIHQNTYEQEKVSGTQIFYSPNNPYSKILAENMKDAFVENLQPDNKKPIVMAKKNVYIIFNAKTPTILVECGFLTNRAEAEKLSSDEYRGEVAKTIYMGIKSFLKKNNEIPEE